MAGVVVDLFQCMMMPMFLIIQHMSMPVLVSKGVGVCAPIMRVRDNVGVQMPMMQKQCVYQYKNGARKHYYQRSKVVSRERLTEEQKRQCCAYVWSDGIIGAGFCCAKPLLCPDIKGYTQSIGYKP